MRVNQALVLPHGQFRQPLELSGYLIVSSHLVCIVEDEATARSGRPHFGILVNRDAIAALDRIDLPLLGGSSVSIVGDISLKGTVTHTGIAALPLYIPYIYEFTFTHACGAWRFHIGDTFKDIYLLSQPALPVRSVALLKPLFDPALTVIQLKRQLESQPEHLVGRHLRGEALSNLAATIEAAGFTWRTQECEIEGGIA